MSVVLDFSIQETPAFHCVQKCRYMTAGCSMRRACFAHVLSAQFVRKEEALWTQKEAVTKRENRNGTASLALSF
jgi:hypothetical protein